MRRFFHFLFAAALLVACDNSSEEIDNNSNGNSNQNEDNKDDNKEPSTNRPGEEGERGAYLMPYTRYDSREATQDGDASRITGSNNKAAEASNMEYIQLTSSGASVSWTLSEAANGVTIRFTLPDNNEGTGTTSTIEFLRNDEVIKELDLTSYWAYQYFLPNGNPSSVPLAEALQTGIVAFQFDETHTLLGQTLEVGDKFSVRLKSGNPTGVDFVELEMVDAPRTMPAGAISILDYGAIPNDDIDDLAAIESAISELGGSGKTIFIPEGKFIFSNRIKLFCNNLRIEGAGMWHTHLYFSNDNRASGGFYANGSDLYVGHIYCSTINSARWVDPTEQTSTAQKGYKTYEGSWRNSKIEYLWENHFVLGGQPTNIEGVETDGLTVSHARLRNNYAAGCNFIGGSKNCILEHCSVRDCGDDSIVTWASAGNDKHPCGPTENNTFRYNTVEFGYRASTFAIFGGSGHKAYGNLFYESNNSTAGIRITSTFDDYPFYTDKSPIEIYDCTIYRCGYRPNNGGRLSSSILITSKYYPIEGIHFRNIDIYDSYTDAIRIGVINPSEISVIRNVTFDNIRIKGAGKDGKSGGADAPANYRGAGIYTYVQNGGTDTNSSITLSKITCEDCPNGSLINDGKFTINYK